MTGSVIDDLYPSRLITKGRRCIQEISGSHMDVIVTDEAVRRILNGDMISIIQDRGMTIAHYYDRTQSVQLFLDYLHGQLQDQPSYMVYWNHVHMFPFSYDMHVTVIASAGMALSLFRDVTLTNMQKFTFISQFVNEVDLVNAINSGNIPTDLPISDVAAMQLRKLTHDNRSIMCELQQHGVSLLQRYGSKMNDDILNHILMFLPTKELRNWRLTPDTFTSLIERDFPLTISKDPQERYLGLLNTDIISKGQMAITLMELYAPDSIDKAKLITASGVKATMKKQPVFATCADTFYMEYAYNERSVGDTVIEYLHGNVDIDEPSLVVTKDSYNIFPFSCDKVHAIMAGLREIANILGINGHPRLSILGFIASFPNTEAMRGINVNDVNLNDYYFSVDFFDRMRHALNCSDAISKFVSNLHP